MLTSYLFGYVCDLTKTVFGLESTDHHLCIPNRTIFDRSVFYVVIFLYLDSLLAGLRKKLWTDYGELSGQIGLGLKIIYYIFVVVPNWIRI